MSKFSKFAALLTALLCSQNLGSAAAQDMLLTGVAGTAKAIGGSAPYLPQAVHFDVYSGVGVSSGDITNGAPRSCHFIASFWHRSAWYNYQGGGGTSFTTDFGGDSFANGSNVGQASETPNGVDLVIDSARAWGLTFGNAVAGTVPGNTSAANNMMTTINPTFVANFPGKWPWQIWDSSLWHHYLISGNTCGSYSGGFGSNVFCGVMYVDFKYALGGSGGSSTERTTCGGPSVITGGSASAFDGSTCGSASFCIDLANVNNTGFAINISRSSNNWNEGDYADVLIWYNSQDVIRLCTGNAAPVPECKASNQPYISATDLANFMGSGAAPAGSAAIPLNPSVAIAAYGTPVVEWSCGTTNCNANPSAFAVNQGSGLTTGFLGTHNTVLPYGPGGQAAHTSGIRWICTVTNSATGSSGAYTVFASNCQNGPYSGGGVKFTAGDLYYVVYALNVDTSPGSPSCTAPTTWPSE
jgi:hypothetical protein